MDIKNFTIKSLADGFKAKEFSALEVAEEFFKEIESRDKGIGAYLSLTKDEAFLEAGRADALRAEGGEVSPLVGIPLAIKDNMLIKGYPATAASHMLEHYTASYDATVIKKLKESHAVFLGKTNLDEFAMGSSTENSAFHITKNPHDMSRVAGGSSGGSATAVVAGLAVAGLGSDTGGSIRQPAALCGVVGMKPTYGAVSRFGLIAMSSSLDQIGPLTKTVEDSRILFNIIRGKDVHDATSTNFADSHSDIKKLTIGIPKEYFVDGIDPAVTKGVEEAVQKLKKLGFSFKEISLPHTKYALSVYYIIMPAEVSTNLARFDGIRYSRDVKDVKNLKELYVKNRAHGFGPETRRRLLLGTFVLSSGYYDAYYAKAQKVRRLIKEDFENAFKDVDIILSPVTPTPAFKIGEKTADPLSMYLSDIFTIPANLAGIPAISIPVKKYTIGSGELPIGFQLMGKHFHEADLFGIGELYERE
ncbi:MAG: Asp-tRNA(Asn)/Glu-tRNA(Gln) amidotransferase subunit GatA [Patescibacteria group bacterium]